MYTPGFVNKLLNFSEKLSSAVRPKEDKASDACICGHVVKKRPTKRINTKEQIRFVNEAAILSHKDVPTFSFWSGYRPGCGITYFEQAFYDVKEVGHGDFGLVYAATYRDDGKRYAVKKMHYPYKSETNRRMLQREALIHEQFDDCLGILRFYGAWEEEDRLYMQLELCKYSLADIKYCRKCINSENLTKFAADILTGVQALHNKNVLHFDIKPENIFVTNDGKCKLGDFGIALQLSVDDLRDVDEGDGRYLAREVLNSAPTVAADIFSIGMTLLELAAKVDLPSHGAEFHHIRNGIINREWLNAVDDPILRALILWMINSDPIKRPTAAEALEVLATFKNKTVLSKDHVVVLFLILAAVIIVGFYYFNFLNL